MEKTINIPADLLERAREIPETANMTDGQLVSLYMREGLASAERTCSPVIRDIVAEINHVLDRACFRQLELILRASRAIVGKEG